MRAGQTLLDNNNRQVALFPLSGFSVSQSDTDTFSHDSRYYWATDYLGLDSNGNRIYRCPCYAPVDIKCIFLDRNECGAVWESLEPVHLANGMIDYLTMIVYHDNDIQDGITQVGTIKRQGEIFNKTGDGAYATGDHMHLETGYGRYLTNTSTGWGTSEYKYHITDFTAPKRLHNYDALFINDTSPHTSPSYYDWKTFQGGHPTPTKKYHFKWVLYANKLRNNRNV